IGQVSETGVVAALLRMSGGAVGSRETLVLAMVLSFFFKDPPPPEIYTLSLHDALPISMRLRSAARRARACRRVSIRAGTDRSARSEEHTSELQSRGHLVCRLLLEKKKKTLTLPPQGY